MLMFLIEKASFANIVLSRQTILPNERQLKQTAIYQL